MEVKHELVTDLEAVQRLAKERFDEFEVMRYTLELRDDLTDAQIDALVEETAAPIIAAIDCKQCGNCCRSLHVYLAEQDGQRLADHLDIPLEEVEMRYIDHEEAARVGEWGKFRAVPCVFLHGRLCSVYASRPDSCRNYPFFTPDFRWTLEDTIDGAAICPIIYNLLSQMVQKVNELY